MSLFPDETASTPMVKHTMKIGKCVTEFLNPGQIPVLGRGFTDTSMHACRGGGGRAGVEAGLHTDIFARVCK